MILRKLQFLIGILLVCGSALLAQENTEHQQDIRMAVIDVGSKEAPDSFSQFLWINIAETQDIVLVEREQINKILREQTLNLKFSYDSDTENFVKAGKILGADFLLMFESGNSTQGQIPIRFRLVETRYGMKFWDYALMLDIDEKIHPAQAKEICETIINKLQAKNKYGNFTYVGIGAFRSEELSQNWNWISDDLAAGIEQKLVSQPSIILLERGRTRPLMNERDLVEGLPDTLRSSVVFIDGSYRVDRQKNDKSISVTFYGYSNNQKIFTINIEGSSDNIRELSQKASIAITEKLNIEHKNIAMDPAREASLLIEQAKSFEAFKDYRRAAILYETTLAIDPFSVDSIMGLLKIASFLPQEYGINEINDEKRELYKREIIPLYLNNIIMMKRFAENYPDIKAKYGKKLHPIHSWQQLLVYARYLYIYPSNVYRMLGNHEDTLDILRTFQAHLSEFEPLLAYMAKNEDDKYIYSQVVQVFIEWGDWWASSPQEYLDKVKTWLELAVGKNPNDWDVILKCYSYNFDRCPLWKDRTGNNEVYLVFLDELSQHNHPLIRACAYQAFVEYYTDNNTEMTSRYYNKFIDTIVNEVIPAFPEWGHQMTTWNKNLDGEAIKAVGQKCITESKARIIHQVLKYSQKFHMGIWDYDVELCYIQLERTGEINEAAQLLLACRDKLLKEYPDKKENIEKINSWLRKLEAQHPEVAIELEINNESIPTEERELITLLNIGDFSEVTKKYMLFSSRNCFRRLLTSDKTAAIVCLWGNETQAGCGIIWLDPETFAYRKIQMYDPSFKFSVGNVSNDQTSFNRSGPVSAICDNTVYVSFPNFGILIFPENGTPQLLSEENGLPTSIIKSMDILNGRIYAVTGDMFTTGLIEIEPETMQSRILISPRKRENPNSLDGRNFGGIVTDHGTNNLWLRMNTRGGSFSYFKPDTGQISQIPEELANNVYFFSRQGNIFYISTSTELYSLNTSTKQKTLLANHNISKIKGAKRAFWQTDLDLRKFAGNSKSLIAAIENNAGESFVVIFNAGEPEPKKLTGKSFPSFNNIKNFGCTDKGIFILTGTDLYLMPHKDINTN